MKYILKTSEPISFTQWKVQNAGEIRKKGDNAKKLWRYWGHPRNNDIRRELKERLLEDQGFICCYCMQEVNNDAWSVIEHLDPKSKDPQKLTFNFSNLLIACHGEGKTPQPKIMHCDGEKQRFAEPPPVSPLTPNCSDHFKFTLAGEISALTSEGSETINMLNLKAVKLVNLRKAAIEQELEETITETEAIERISKLSQKRSNNRFEPFCIAIISVLAQEFNLTL